MERPPWWRGDLVLLYVSMAVTRVGFGVIIILFPIYLSGVSDITLAVVLALYPVLEAVSAVPIGGFCDVGGRKRVFISGLAAMALLIGLIGLTRNVILISWIHAVMGIAAASITVSSLTMITDLTVTTNRGKGMGSFDFSNIGGYAVGLILGGRLHDYFAGRLGDAFLVTALAVVAALAVSLVFLKEPDHVRSEGKMELNPLKVLDARTKAILPIWLSLTSLLGVVFFLPRVFRDIGVQATSTGDFLFIGILALGIGSIGFGAVSDRIGRERTMLIGVVGLLVLLVGMGGFLGSNPTGERLVPYLVVLGPAALATSALVPSILAAVGDRVQEEFRGASMGLYSLMLSLGIALGELLAGLAHHFGGLQAMLYGGAVIFLMAAVGSFILLHRVRRGNAAPL